MKPADSRIAAVSATRLAGPLSSGMAALMRASAAYPQARTAARTHAAASSASQVISPAYSSSMASPSSPKPTTIIRRSAALWGGVRRKSEPKSAPSRITWPSRSCAETRRECARDREELPKPGEHVNAVQPREGEIAGTSEATAARRFPRGKPARTFDQSMGRSHRCVKELSGPFK